MFKQKANTFIELTDNKSVYIANEVVSGNLVVDAYEEISFARITIKFKGFAEVHWTEQSGSGESRRTEYFGAEENYFSDEITVLGPDVGEDRTILLGRNFYPFSYKLPTDLPSSIEVKHGYVRYMVEGTILPLDICTMTLFTVLDVLDLNHDPNSRTPSSGSDTKMMCCWCCASGPIEARISTDKSGYVPGEFINLNGSIENKSSSNLPGSKVSLVQLVTEHSTTKSRHFTVKVAKEKGPKCKRQSSAHISNARLQIPPLPPSSLRFCSIIDVEYYLEYCIDTTACHSDLWVELPIVIGTVPLRPDPNQPLRPIISTSETQFQPYPNSNQMGVTQHVPPPTFSAAAAAKVETKTTYDGTARTFAPQYNYYDWSQPTFSHN